MHAARKHRQSLRILLLRFHKDRRARRKLFWLALLVLVCGYELLNLVLLVFNPGTWIMAPFVAIALWMIARSKRADEQSFLKLSTPGPSEPSDAAFESHKARLITYLRLEAGWASRTLGEAVLKQAKSDRYNSTIGMRSSVNAVFRDYRLWHELSDNERMLMMAPEGTWSSEDIHRHFTSCERARVLMWALGLGTLPPPSTAQSPEIRSVIAVCRIPSSIKRSRTLMPPYELRMQKHLAGQYFTRCLWELEHRAEQGSIPGLFVDDEERRDFLQANSSELWGDENADLLIGEQVVSQADSELVLRILGLSFTRYCTLNGILRYLEGPAEAQLHFDSFVETGDTPESDDAYPQKAEADGGDPRLEPDVRTGWKG